jgi:replicative DNA helicase Mcm
LADQGDLEIDEFDKARPEDMDALHEIMEQQQASFAKAGIVATLNTRVSIVAAMNPVNGKYDPYKNLVENIGSISIPLLSRFDLVFVLIDSPDSAIDDEIGQHIGSLRKKKRNLSTPLTTEFLKRYIRFAKNLDPELTDEAFAKLLEYWKAQRRGAQEGQMLVTPRWLEALCRLTIARARLLLHERSNLEDALAAIGLMNAMLSSALTDVNTKKEDVGLLYNKPVSEKGLREAALEIFKKLSGESRQPVEDKAFYAEMDKTTQFSREQVEKIFQDMWKGGIIYEKKLHWYLKA